MPRISALFAASALVLAASPAFAEVSVELEKAAIAKAVDAAIGWFATKDFDLLFRTIADDDDYFCITPTSKDGVHGIAAFREQSAIWRDPGARYLSHEIRDLRIHLHPSGEVAWFSAMLDDCGEYGGRRGCWLHTRWTGVLEKREGRWVMMQQHFSFAADEVREQVQKSLRGGVTSEAPQARPTP